MEQNDKKETPQVSLQEVLEQFNQRLGVLENLVTEMMKGFQMSGQAINRLESFTFTQIKVMLDSELVTFADLTAKQKQLQGFDNLHDFWGVEPIEDEEASSEENTTSSEE